MIRLLLVLALFPASLPAGEPPRPSPSLPGTHFLGDDLRALQADDFANPGMLWVARGEQVWARPPANGAASCAGCHGPAAGSMKGVASRYPRHDPALGRVVNLDERIDACNRQHQSGEGFAPNSADALALGAFVAHQSRGSAMAVSIDGPARATYERGRALFGTRIGQLNLACSHCHDASWGKTLLAEPISQGQPTGWPAYRLDWQSLGTLQRRLRACFAGVRAEPPAYGSGDLVALELYLAARARGLPVEAPAVRR